MKTALIAIVCLAVIIGAILFVLRREHVHHGNVRASALLRSHLAEGRNYLYYVGIPLHSPTEWKQLEIIKQTLFLAGEALQLDNITAVLVVYPNGEVLSSEQEFFPLPEGVRFVEPRSNPRQDILDPSELIEGQAYVKISYGPSKSRRGEPGNYSTTIRNISNNKIRVLRFAAFIKSGSDFRLDTISGDYFSADEFINWYDTAPDGWIQPGESVADPNNYGGGDGYWAYYFETEEGKLFTAGARIPR